MKLYLSSYRVGDNPARLNSLVGDKDAKVAVCVNAVDAADPAIRTQKLTEEMAAMRSLGFVPEEVDLRTYFGRPGLADKLRSFDLIWIRGGNVFVLRKAMKYSGFDDVVKVLVRPGKLVYAGYSAAVCVGAPSLKGAELVDDKDEVPEGYRDEVIWDGYGLIDFYPIVHYKSGHPESQLVEKELEYVKSQGLPYRTLRDGEVIIIDGQQES